MTFLMDAAFTVSAFDGKHIKGSDALYIVAALKRAMGGWKFIYPEPTSDSEDE